MMRSLLLVALAAFSAPSFVGAELTNTQKTALAGWEKFSTDPEALRAIYTSDATFLLCMDPEPCTEGTFDEVIAPFMQVTSKFYTKWTFDRTLEGSFGIGWIDYLETPDGCGQVFSGSAHFEVNQEGKVTRHVAFSNNAHDIYDCVNNYVKTLETKQE